MSEKFKPRTFKLSGTANQQHGIRNACFDFIDSVMTQHDVIDVTISLHEESRRTAQNRLMWLWNGQIGQTIGVSPDYAHGMCKLDIGLPYMLTEKPLHSRAMFISDVLEHVIERKHKVAVAYDMVRSKDLTVAQFATYLTAVDKHFAAQGIVLASPDDLRNAALNNTRQAA